MAMAPWQTHRGLCIVAANDTVAYDADWNDIERAARPTIAAARLLHSSARQRTNTSRWWTMRWPSGAVSVLGRVCGGNTVSLASRRALASQILGGGVDVLQVTAQPRSRRPPTSTCSTRRKRGHDRAVPSAGRPGCQRAHLTHQRAPPSCALFSFRRLTRHPQQRRAGGLLPFTTARGC